MIIPLILSVSLVFGQECSTTIKGIFSKQISEFERAVNQLRNEVSQARRPNHLGKNEYAANMQIATWSVGLARGAQNCAERCPDSESTCKNLKGDYGILFKSRTMNSLSEEWEPKGVINKWMDNQSTAEQLVVSNVSQFGCGRAIKKVVDKYLEYLVCFFDKVQVIQLGSSIWESGIYCCKRKEYCKFVHIWQIPLISWAMCILVFKGICFQPGIFHQDSGKLGILIMIQLFIFVSVALPEQQCNITAKGVTSKQASQFEQLLNTIRNDVATGRRANHKGQIMCASDLHMITWSKEMAKDAQNCAENCPEAPLFCKNMKGQNTFMIHKQIVHASTYDLDPEFIFDEWMASQIHAQQLLQAMLFKIGCGRALTPLKGKYLVYTVCYFDYVCYECIKPKKSEPYRQTSCLNVPSFCRLGHSSSYSGLCISPYSQQSFVQIQHSNRIVESK